MILVLYVTTKQFHLSTEMDTSVPRMLFHHSFCNADQKDFEPDMAT